MNIQDLAGLSKFLKKLIDVLREIYEPWQVVRMARAKQEEIALISDGVAKAAEAHLDVEYDDGKLRIREATYAKDVRARASSRDTFLRVREQQNVDAVISMAAQELEGSDDLSDEHVDTDWVVRFVEMAGKVSAKEVQILWAKILAGEIREPGAFSLRTLETLRNLTRDEAIAFSHLMNFALMDTDGKRGVLLVKNITRGGHPLEYIDMLKLSDAGLVSLTTSIFKSAPLKPKEELVLVESGQERFVVTSETGMPMISTSVQSLTTAGYELIALFKPAPDLDHARAVFRPWLTSKGVIVRIDTVNDSGKTIASRTLTLAE